MWGNHVSGSWAEFCCVVCYWLESKSSMYLLSSSGPFLLFLILINRREFWFLDLVRWQACQVLSVWWCLSDPFSSILLVVGRDCFVLQGLKQLLISSWSLVQGVTLGCFQWFIALSCLPGSTPQFSTLSDFFSHLFSRGFCLFADCCNIFLLSYTTLEVLLFSYCLQISLLFSSFFFPCIVKFLLELCLCSAVL